MKDVVNGHNMNLIQPCNRVLRHCFQKFSNRWNICVFKLRRRHLLSFCVSPLVDGICHILGVRAYEVMVWIHARGIIAARTVVTQFPPLWNRPSKKLPDYTMSLSSSIPSSAVSVSGYFIASPEPTGVGFVDSSPNPVWKSAPLTPARPRTKLTWPRCQMLKGLRTIFTFGFSFGVSSVGVIADRTAKLAMLTWAGFEFFPAKLAKAWRIGRGCVRHNESLSFCLGGAGRFDPSRTAAKFTIRTS